MGGLYGVPRNPKRVGVSEVMQLHHSNFRRYRKAYRVESPFPWASNYLLLLVIDGLLLYLLVYLS